MSEAVEGGVIAWRLLATLEGGSLLLAASALIAYTATYRFVRNNRGRRLVNTVLITNTKNKLGRLIEQRLEDCGCKVSTVTSEAASGVTSGSDKVDALIVVGAETDPINLDGISDLVTEDVYSNLKLLEHLSPRVNIGGIIAWACAEQKAEAGAGAGAFRGTATAFDNVLQTTLKHVAKVCHCKAVWIGRSDKAERAAERLVAALMMTDTTHQDLTRFSVRNAAIKVGGYLYKCLKTVTCRSIHQAIALCLRLHYD